MVSDPVRNVTISGFDVAGFPGSGIFFLGADNPVVSRNVTTDNEEYGIVRFSSSGGKIVGNRASGSAEAGSYVGDSPNADVLVAGNDASDNEQFGFFFRDAAHGDVVRNRARQLHRRDRTQHRRQRSRRLALHREQGQRQQQVLPRQCGGANGRELGHRNSDRRRVRQQNLGNYIRDNTPSGAVDFAGGVVVADLGIPGAKPPSGNVVKRNVVLGNQPDIFWDGSGSGNAFDNNLCRTSVPDGLCDSWHSGHHGSGWHSDDHGSSWRSSDHGSGRH